MLEPARQTILKPVPVSVFVSLLSFGRGTFFGAAVLSIAILQSRKGGD
jgi:hypothetical protein